MVDITFKGNKVHTYGELPKIGMSAPNFKLTGTDLSSVTLDGFKGKKTILNIFPSLDTEVCAASVRKFNQAASDHDVHVLCISADLPFAHKRFCSTEGLDKIVSLSVFRSQKFGHDYGLTMVDGPLEGLLARAVVLLDENGKVLYTQLVPEVTQEPNYEQVLEHLNE